MFYFIVLGNIGIKGIYKLYKFEMCLQQSKYLDRPAGGLHNCTRVREGGNNDV